MNNTILNEYYNTKTKTLMVPYYYNEKLEYLPQDVQTIIFNEDKTDKFKYSKFNRSVDHLPSTVTHIIFGSGFNRPINKLPRSITHLTLGFNFNHSVDNLQNSITHLTFGHYFDCLVNKLPNSITHLIFGDDFERCVNNLPNSIIHLTFYTLYFVSKPLQRHSRCWHRRFRCKRRCCSSWQPFMRRTGRASTTMCVSTASVGAIRPYNSAPLQLFDQLPPTRSCTIGKSHASYCKPSSNHYHATP